MWLGELVVGNRLLTKFDFFRLSFKMNDFDLKSTIKFYLAYVYSCWPHCIIGKIAPEYQSANNTMDHKVGNRHYKPLEKMDNNEIEEEDNDTEMEELNGGAFRLGAVILTVIF